MYESITEQFKQPYYPISIEKIKVFINYQAKHGITINTLKSYISGISHYFKRGETAKF